MLTALANAIGWAQQYALLLGSLQQGDWERARTLKLANAPAQLFRYRLPNEYALKDLSQGTVWLAQPRLFNDPFDSAAALDAVAHIRGALLKHPRDWVQQLPGVSAEMVANLQTAEEPVRAIDEILASEVAKQEGAEAGEKAKGLFEKRLAQFSRALNDRMSQVNQRGLKIACFSETGNSLPLWAYYTDNHKGFCVAYPIWKLPPTEAHFRMLHPVIYTSATSILTSLLGSGGMNPFFPTLAAIHKSADWSYEREWRLVHPAGDDSLGVDAAMPTPSGLLLGIRMEAAYRDKVTAIANAKGIPVFEMTLSPEKFELQPVATPKVASTV